MIYTENVINIFLKFGFFFQNFFFLRVDLGKWLIVCTMTYTYYTVKVKKNRPR